MLERNHSSTSARDTAGEPSGPRGAKELLMTTPIVDRIRVRRPLGVRSGSDTCRPARPQPDGAPIVVAADGSRAAAAAMQAAVRLGRDLAPPVVFVHVRRGPSSALGEPYYQRRLDANMSAGRRLLDDALAVAERAGVPATAEQLAENPARCVVEFARLRGARLVVLGSRRRRLGRSVSRDVIRSADRPVLVAGDTAPVAA
jgi:nucleotide-binding universal stress UspA family protein